MHEFREVQFLDSTLSQARPAVNSVVIRELSILDNELRCQRIVLLSKGAARQLLKRLESSGFHHLSVGNLMPCLRFRS